VLSDLLYRLRALFRRKSMETELDGELRAHLERQQEKYVQSGLPVEEARRRVRLEFGGLDQVKEECRDARGVRFIETMLQDLRYSLRSLARNPAFTTVTVLTLALGIGVNTAIFSLINAVMLKSLPVRQPERLVLFQWAAQGWPVMIPSLRGTWNKDKSGRTISTSFTYPAFEETRASNKVLSGICAFSGAGRLNLVAGGQAGLAEADLVSGDYFSTLGVQPILGRPLTPADDRPEAPRAAVISYGYWRRRFGGDVSVVSKSVTLNDVPFTIVGVSPPEFFGVQPGRSVDLWLPLHAESQVLPDADWSRTNWWLLMMGRLKNGVSQFQALANLQVIFRQSVTAGVRSLPKEAEIPQLELAPGNKGLDYLRSEFSQPLFILMTVVGLVLLIACANVANLLLERATSRRREIAVRLALGAGRGRLVRQLLTESAALSAAGGVAGLLLAYWASNLLVVMMSSGRGRIDLHVRPDVYVLIFTASLSILTALLVGLAPALRGTRLDLTPALKAGPTGAGGRPRRFAGLRFGLAKGLVVAQVAISLVLLVAAGLFVRTLANLENENIGFDRRNLLLFGIDPTQQGYKGARLTRFYEELQGRLKAIPGARSVSLSMHPLLKGEMSVWGLVLDGYVPKTRPLGNDNSISVRVNEVGPDFFATMGIPLLLGRTIQPGDTATSPMVGVVNEAFAHKYLEGQPPVGRRAGWEGEERSKMEIVGVVKDTRYGELRGDPPPTYYVPYTQYSDHLGAMYFEVRTAGDPKNWLASIGDVVRSLDKEIPIFDAETQTEEIDEAVFQERLFARLTSLFGALALLLACLGLYGLMSYSVARRSNEIGIRMALGAERARILRWVLIEALGLVLCGLALGIPVALGATRLISSRLYGLKPNDALTLSLATLLLAAVAILAAYIPARRATKVDPVVALRYE
jgi:predicted permease